MSSSASLQNLGHCQMLFEATRFHVFVTIGWQFSIFTACLILFPIFSNYIPEWQCDGGPPTRSCETWSSCPGNITFVDTPFYSAAIEFDWICGSSSLYRSLQSQMQFFGMLFATITVGFATDLVGRKPVAVTLLAVGVLNQLLSGYVSSWHVFLATRCIVGFVAGGVLIAVHTLVMELLLPQQRMAVRAFANWGTARLCLTLICWWAGSWRTTSFLCAAVSFPALAIILLVYPESPTWLHSKGYTDRLKKAEQHIARFSGKTYQPVPTKAATKNKSFLQLVRSPGLFRHLLVFWCMWFVGSLSVYSTDLNSNTISGHFFFNQVCICAVLICSKLLLVTIDTKVPSFSRRTLHQSAQFIVCCAYVSLTVMAIYKYKGVGVLLANILGTVCIEFTWDACYLCVVESMETSCRASATGSCALVARIGGIMAPMLAHTSTIWSPAVYLTVTLLGLANLLVSFLFLKDHKDVNLDDVRISESLEA